MDLAPKRPVPVFPLPGTVLFPGAEMALHIFELRYRTMVRDALSSERLIGLATLSPGWEHDYHGSPPYHELGCVARFEDVEWLPNDHYQLRVRGSVRVRFGRVVREYPYRACTVEAIPDNPYTDDDPLIRMVRQELLAERSRLGPLGPDAWLAPPVFEPTANLLTLVGALATAARISDADKLALLAEDSVVDRARRLCDHLRRLGPGRNAPPPPPELGIN
ncbi:MAG: LON peptidase substrate-binding domain-containing protein [Candidatus Eisenbacteria bacterium]|nr:LON peptidase substrate-binding domain-containing protein [Candidatus Eisenbacteria bacterium]